MALTDLTTGDFEFYRRYSDQMRSTHEKEFCRVIDPDLMRMLYRGMKLKHNEENDQYYYDKISGENFFNDKNNFLTLSRMFQGANTILPNLYYQNPQPIAVPKKGATPYSSALMASALKHYMTVNEAKRENQEAVMNAWFYGLGWKKLGYRTVFFPRESIAQEPESMLDKFGEVMRGAANALGLRPDNLESRERPDIVDYETLFNNSESPLNIHLDHKADLRNCKVINHKVPRTLYDLECFGDYDETILEKIYDKMKHKRGTRLSSREIDLNLNEMHIQQRNGVWILTWVDEHDEPFRYEKSTYQGKGFQFEPLVFTNEPGVRYPISHMKVASQAQIKIDDMATLFVDIVSRIRTQVIINEKILAPGQKAAIEANKTGGIIWTNKGISASDYAQLTNPAASTDLPTLMTIAQKNLTEILGADEQMISGKSVNKTLGQDELARVGTKIRESGMLDKVHDFMVNQLRKESILLKEYSKAELHLKLCKKDYYRPDTGAPITEEWVSFMTPENPVSLKESLQGEFDFEVNMYEAVKPDKEKLRQEYMEAITLFSNPDVRASFLERGVAVRIDKLAEGLAKNFEHIQADEFLEQLDPRQQAIMQVQSLLMQNKGALQSNVTSVPQKGKSASASAPEVSNPSSEAQNI